MSVRKVGKADWRYRCTLCDYDSPRFPDELRALERGLTHERSTRHFNEALAAAFRPVGQVLETIVDAFAGTINAVAESLTGAFDQSSYALAPPPNAPHDPALRADRRKWGGK